MPLEKYNGVLAAEDPLRISFPMTDMRTGSVVTCTISTKALCDHFGATPDDVEIVFEENREIIEGKASALYNEDQNSVHITEKDF